MGFYVFTLMLLFILKSVSFRCELLWSGWSRGDSGEEHEHQSDAVLGSVMVFRLAAGAVAEVVVPLGILNEIWVFTLAHSVYIVLPNTQNCVHLDLVRIK